MKRFVIGTLVATILLFIILNFTLLRKHPSVLSIYDENIYVFSKLLIPIENNIKKKRFDNLISKIELASGNYGLYIKDLNNSKVYSYNESDEFYAASLYKLPIAVTLIKEVELGNKDLDYKINLQPNDIQTGTGSLSKLEPGTELSLDNILNKLLKESDNAAQAILLRVLSTGSIQRTFGLSGKISNNQFYHYNQSSPSQIALFIESVLHSDYLSKTNKEILLNKMSQTHFDNRINSGLNQDLSYSHKIGNWPKESSWHDCGVVRNRNKDVLVCLMSRNTSYKDFLEVSKSVGKFINILF